MEHLVAPQAPLPHQVIHPARPIRDWLALARQHGVSATPIQVVETISNALQTILKHPSPIRLGALWMSADGRLEVVLPAHASCSVQVCCADLGILACEMLSGTSLHATDPIQALHQARTQAMPRTAAWHFLEALVGRLLGVSGVFASLEEAESAARSVKEHLAIPASLGTPMIPVWAPPYAYTAPPISTAPPPQWFLPALAGFGVAMILVVAMGGAYALGARQQHQPTPSPIVVTVPTPAPAPIAAAIDPIKKPHAAHAAQPKPPVKAAAAADVEDGPTYVGDLTASLLPPTRQAAPSLMPPFSPSPRDSRRVADGDFVARPR